MRTFSLAARAGAGVLILVTAACGSSSSTGPKGASAAALHFDSLFVAAAAHGSNWSYRTSLLALLELATASGATAASVAVTVGGAAQTWHAVGLVVVDTNSSGAVADSQLVTITYSDANATNAVLGEVDFHIGGSTTYLGQEVIDTVEVNSSSETYTGSITSTSGTCGLVAGLQNTQIQQLRALYACTDIHLQSTMTAAFPAVTGIDASFQNVSFTNLSTPGVMLFQ